MPFDLASAQPAASGGFDLSTAKPAGGGGFDLGTAKPVGDANTLQHDNADTKPKGPIDRGFDWLAKKTPDEAKAVLHDVGEHSANVARELATVGDMFGNIGTSAVALMKNTERQLQGIGKGEDPGVTIRAAKKVQEEFQQTQPDMFKNFVGLFTPKGQEPGPTHIESAMNSFMKMTTSDFQALEGQTHGLVKAEGLEYVRDVLMTALGAKPFAAGAKAIGARVGPRIEPIDPKAPATWEAAKPPDATPLQEKMAARQKYTSDPEYARHYSEKADAEATKAAVPPEQPTPAESPTGVSNADMPTLISALGKTTKGQAFALTAAEKVALRANQATWPGKLEKGAADPDLLAAMAIGGVGTALMLAYPDKVKDALEPGMTLFALGSMKSMKEKPDTAPLGALLSTSDTTLKILEKPEFQNKWDFNKQEIEGALKQQGVTGAEQKLVKEILDSHPGERITAKQLMVSVKEATGDWELKKAESDEYANYGLDNIGRVDPERGYDAMPGEGEAPSKTHIWQLPDHMAGASDNHFSDPRYFGHTRTFEEEGIRHVVEVQSDLAQKAGKVLTEEERAGLEKTRAELDQQALKYRKLFEEAIVPGQHNRMLEKISQMPEFEYALRRGENDVAGILRRELSLVKLKQTELQTKLAASSSTARLTLILKNWPKRLIREELADAVRERAKLDKEAQELATKLRGYGDEESLQQAKELEDRQNVARIVRFASADTVAKVEGWPQERLPIPPEIVSRVDALERAGEYGEARKVYQQWEGGPGRRLSSASHQGIYDRYQGDVTKFLKSLGGKEHTDAQGHTWIDVPYTPGMRRVQQFGGVKQDLLTGMAAVGLGLYLGATLDKDNPIEGAVLGVLTAAAIKSGVVGRAVSLAKELAKPDSSIRITDTMEKFQYDKVAGARVTAQAQRRIADLVPDEAGQKKIFKALDEGTMDTLTGKVLEAARIAQAFYANLGRMAKDLKILQGLHEDYATHIWDLSSKKAKAIYDQLIASKSLSVVKPGSKFSKERVFLPMAEGKAAGLVPKTENIVAAMGIYGNDMFGAIASRNLINTLKAAKTAAGDKLIQSAVKAPRSFEQVDHPSLRGFVVHPDIAHSMKFLFEAQTPGAILSALEAVNTAIKRNTVSFSLFHARSLFDAGLGALNNPLTAVKVLAQSAAPRLFGENLMLKQMREGGAGDLVDLGLKSGLELSFDSTAPVVEDVGGGFYKGFESAQRMLNQTLAKSGDVTVGTYLKANKAIDSFMWGRLHPAFKLTTFAAKVEALLENNAKAGKPITPEAAGKIAAGYTNDVFGGLNWMRIAEGINNRMARNMALSAFSPFGRLVTRLVMFAPDWTLSTSRAFFKSFGKGSGVGGLMSAKTLADLHRQQFIRSAFYFAVIGDTINYANTGRHLWENKDKDGNTDWTSVYLSDGRRMQLSKHFAEPFHLMMNPAQTGLNKLAYMPKEAGMQLTGQEWLSASGRTKPMDTSAGGRLKHAAKGLLPIGVQQFRDQSGETDVTSGVSGMLGSPIYGKPGKVPTPEAYARQQAQKERARERKAADADKAAERKRRAKERKAQQ